MKNPIKLDIEAGAEWLLPAAKRWLEQAKRTTRTPLGAKVFDLLSGEKVTVQWRQGLDYVRISSGGAVAVVGSLTTAGGSTSAFYWTPAGGVVDMGNISGYNSSTATLMAGDGSVIVGTHKKNGLPDIEDRFWWRWTKDTGMVAMPQTIFRNTEPQSMSADGTIVVGLGGGFSSDPALAWKWTEETGMIDIGHPDRTPYARATGISADGGTIFGVGVNNLRRMSFTWSEGYGFTDLGYPPDIPVDSSGNPIGLISTTPLFISSNGSVVAGDTDRHNALADPHNYATFMWSASLGMVDRFSGVATGFMFAKGLSESGDTLVAQGAITTGNSAAWSTLYGVEGLKLSIVNGIDFSGRVYGGIDTLNPALLEAPDNDRNRPLRALDLYGATSAQTRLNGAKKRGPIVGFVSAPTRVALWDGALSGVIELPDGYASMFPYKVSYSATKLK